MNEKVLHLIRRIIEITAASKIDYAIGGGVAVNIYGFERETKDVDAFFRYEDRLEVLRAFRKAGLRVDELLAPCMYVATEPEERNLRVRIDLMFPLDDPEVSAVEMATTAAPDEDYFFHPFKVFPVDLLILAKFYTARNRDKLDIAQLLELGAFDPAEPRRLLTLMDPSQVQSYDALIAEISQPHQPRPRPKRK